MFGPGKVFKIEVFRRLENAMLNMVFTNTKAVLLIFSVAFTERMLDILLYPECTMGPPWLGPEKIFLNKGSQKGKKRYIQIGFCKYSIS